MQIILAACITLLRHKVLMKELPPYARFTIIGVGIALVILAMVVASELLLPLSWALLFALLILPVQKRLEKRIRSRAVAAVLSVLILIVIIGGVLYLLSAQVMNLISDLPALFTKISGYLTDLRKYIEQEFGISYKEQTLQLKGSLNSFFHERMQSFGIALTNTLKTIVFIGLMPIYIFLMLYYRERISQFLGMLYGPVEGRAVTHTIWKAGNVVQKYLTGMVTVTFIVAIMVLVLFLALGIKNALFFAVFVAVMNLIPYVGVFFASTVSILYVLVTKDGLIYPILTLALLWSIQLIENNLITPFVVGRQIKLNPLAVIVVLILGGMIWGVSGMVLFIPMLGGLKVILDENPDLRPYGFLLGDDPATGEEKPVS